MKQVYKLNSPKKECQKENLKNEHEWCVYVCVCESVCMCVRVCWKFNSKPENISLSFQVSIQIKALLLKVTYQRHWKQTFELGMSFGGVTVSLDYYCDH